MTESEIPPEPAPGAQNAYSMIMQHLVRPLIELVLPIGIAAGALLMPPLMAASTPEGNFGLAILGGVLWGCFYLWPVYLLTPLFSKDHKFRTLLIWWAALALDWYSWSRLGLGIPASVIPEPYSVILFLFSLEAILAVELMRKPNTKEGIP